MFKKACFLILIVFLFSQVYSVRLVEPISKEISEDSFVGAVVGGQTLELIVSKELGKFDSLELTNLLPKDFGVKVEDYLESIKIFIIVPKSAPQSDYSLKFKISSYFSFVKLSMLSGLQYRYLQFLQEGFLCLSFLMCILLKLLNFSPNHMSGKLSFPILPTLVPLFQSTIHIVTSPLTLMFKL